MLKRRRLIAANWKMNGKLASGVELALGITQKTKEVAVDPDLDFVLCPPATLIWPIKQVLSHSTVRLGGQNCHTATHGAFTGEISANMLADLGCQYVILGHSERRALNGETSHIVAQKVKTAQEAGLTTIVCVGETSEHHLSGRCKQVVTDMIQTSLPSEVDLSKLVIAYEPVWAIGSGQQPSPSEITEIHKSIRQAIGSEGQKVQILYGGSVAPSNAGAILAETEVDGVLVGSASLNVDGFWAIAERARA